ncbi:bi-domain-containing oxidoreductase [bacterium]|nr:bi-domain-containing oxidoreductase [bacterium]
MKQIFFDSSQLPKVQQVCAPSYGDKDILISVSKSLISTGTETAGYDSGSMFSRGLRNPSAIKSVANSVKEQGVYATYKKVKAKKKELVARGYSGAGIVTGVGINVRGFSIGDRVAYAGAPHAEYVVVNEHLVARIPEGVSFAEAAFGALGCIAMHGVRLGEPSLGETCAVIGLGLVGLLAAQLARESGLRVICVEPNHHRRNIAEKLGFSDIIDPTEEEDLTKTLHFFSRGLGMDIMYLCAGIKDSRITNEALSCCRDRGRVIMIGDMGLDLDRAPLFKKELSFKVSRSYGPGRYDVNYEMKGLDYPVGYVRWTEQRNLSLFLEMIQRGLIRVKEMISSEYPIEIAPDAYRMLVDESAKKLAVLLTYKGSETQSETLKQPPIVSFKRNKKDELSIGIIGCGSFVQKELLSNFHALGAKLYGIANRTAKEFSKLEAIYKPEITTTNADILINDPNVDAFIVATHHNTHVAFAKAIIEQGKPVYVEKPLALTLSDAEVLSKLVKDQSGLLTIGFNRRCAPSVVVLKQMLIKSPGPRQFLYRVNAPVLPPDHWLTDPEIGGGRLIGEGCHFIDLICYLANSEVVKVTGGFLGSDSPILRSRDNFAITICFANGDIGTIVYSGQGNPHLTKELIEVFVAGRAFVIDDFKNIQSYGVKCDAVKISGQDKGFKSNLKAFFEAVRGKSELITTVDDGVRVARVIESFLT